jgi:Uncharacterized protein conserved in bacteria
MYLTKEEIKNKFYIKERAENTEVDKGAEKDWLVFQDLENFRYTYALPLVEFKRVTELKGIKIPEGMDARIIEEHRAYSHFKEGDLYFIKDIAINPFTGEKYIVYQALYGEAKIWIRPYNMFCEKVEEGRVDNLTGQIYRFEILKTYKYMESQGSH